MAAAVPLFRPAGREFFGGSGGSTTTMTRIPVQVNRLLLLLVHLVGNIWNRHYFIQVIVLESSLESHQQVDRFLLCNHFFFVFFFFRDDVRLPPSSSSLLSYAVANACKLHKK
jgi:hypothetical protein